MLGHFNGADFNKMNKQIKLTFSMAQSFGPLLPHAEHGLVNVAHRDVRHHVRGAVVSLLSQWGLSDIERKLGQVDVKPGARLSTSRAAVFDVLQEPESYVS